MQDSAAHALRGVGPAVDIPGAEGQPCQPPVEDCIQEWGYDASNGNYVVMTWQGSRGRWIHRFSHLQQYGWRVGHTGQATGPHIHWIMLLDDVRVKPEEQPEFLALISDP